jgi:MFS transporter, putative metabolite:H+ symporter
MSAAVNAGPRLDRIPMGAFHTKVLWLVGLGMFFDSFDNTLSSAALADMLHSGWSTLQLNSFFLSATFAGLTIGAAFAGWLSDRHGRLFAYQFNLAVFGGMAILATFVPSMHWLIPLRFVMGIGMGAEYVMGYGLIVEFIPPQRRGRYLGLLGLIAGAGVFGSSLVGMIVIPWLSWRAMFLIGGMGTIWVWWLRRHLPESPRWLERAGRGAEADAILRRIEAETGTPPMAVVPPVPAPAASPRQVSLGVLFSRGVVSRTLLAIALNITCLFGSYTLTGWMPTFFVRQGMSVTKSLGFNTAMMAGFLAGPLICALLADRLGRRGGLVTFGVICASFAAVYPFLTAPTAIIGCGFLLVSAVAVFLTLGLGGTPELFPTEYRFRGAGLAQMCGRAGLIASPFIVLWLFEVSGIGGVIGAISGMYLMIATLMAVAGIEANQRPLEALEPEAVSAGGFAPEVGPARQG